MGQDLGKQSESRTGPRLSPAGNRGLSFSCRVGARTGGARSHPHEARGADQCPEADEDARNQLGSERMAPAFHEGPQDEFRQRGMLQTAWNACPCFFTRKKGTNSITGSAECEAESSRAPGWNVEPHVRLRALVAVRRPIPHLSATIALRSFVASTVSSSSRSGYFFSTGPMRSRATMASALRCRRCRSSA